MKFTITTLGCKVNQNESETISSALEQSGWFSADKNEKAETCIINTCTVTQKAAMQSRQAIRQAIRSNPDARIIVTGCYAQTEPEELKKIQGVHEIVGHAQKHELADMILSSKHDTLPSSARAYINNISKEQLFRQMPVMSSGNRTRPFLKIQDGCNSFCTYCIVPYARGKSRSMFPDDVLDNILHLSKLGYNEIVLTGIHLGSYGLDIRPETSLLSLLKQIDDLKPINRLRLSSIEPHELTNEMINLIAKSNIICPHFHIPLQSGDDTVLNRMRRPYTASNFSDLILNIHKAIPDAAIGADILIGFPGETDQAFEHTYSLVKNLPMTYLHVFPFSPRKGTPAYSYPDHIQPDIIKERCAKMRSLGKSKKRSFYKAAVNKTVGVLIEGKRDRETNFLKGITPNYISVLTDGKDELMNTLLKVKIDKLLNDNAVFGILAGKGKRF